MGRRAVWFELLDAESAYKLACSLVRLPRSEETIAGVQTAVHSLCGETTGRVSADKLKVFKNRKAYEAKQKPLPPELPIGKLGLTPKTPVIVEIDLSIEARFDPLLDKIEWQPPRRLCRGEGKNWEYQGASALAEKLTDPLLMHFNSWKIDNHDKQMHPFPVVLSGPGTGKSRMLDEMHGILCQAAEKSGNQELVERVKDAYVFHVGFEDETSDLESLCQPKFLDAPISYRMLFQLAKEKKNWTPFALEMKLLYGKLPLTMTTVVMLLAKVEQIDKEADMTVILCVDGLERLPYGDPVDCALSGAVGALCSLVNTSEAFTICVCAGSKGWRIEHVINECQQIRTYLIPPPLCGSVIVNPRSKFETQLVEDMGGHGRALEALQEVLHESQDQAFVDPSKTLDRLFSVMHTRYRTVFDSKLFDNPEVCQDILVSIFSRRRFSAGERIGKSDLRVATLLELGLFRLEGKRWDGHLDCAFIFLLRLLHKMPWRGDGYTRVIIELAYPTRRQRSFPNFVALYRCLKAMVFSGRSVPFALFHAGGRYGPIEGIVVHESGFCVMEDDDVTQLDLTHSIGGCRGNGNMLDMVKWPRKA